MTRDEMVDRINFLLGHRKGDQAVQDARAALKMVQQQMETEATLPYFLRKTDTSKRTSIGGNIIDRPDDFIRLWHEDPISLLIGQSDGTTVTQSLVAGSPGALRARFPGSTFPMGYAEIGRQFQFFPAAQAVYTIVFTYYAHDRKLDTNIENMWGEELSELMIGRAGFFVASGIRDQGAQQIFGALAAAGTEKLSGMSTAQDESTGKPIIGGDD